MDDPVTDDELSLLDRCTSVEEWDAAVAAIRKPRGGSYPCNWFSRVMRSGLADMIFKRWNGTPQMMLPGTE